MKSLPYSYTKHQNVLIKIFIKAEFIIEAFKCHYFQSSYSFLRLIFLTVQFNYFYVSFAENIAGYPGYESSSRSSASNLLTCLPSAISKKDLSSTSECTFKNTISFVFQTENSSILSCPAPLPEAQSMLLRVFILDRNVPQD